ncbi:MAG: hypothetical protein ABJG88_09060 [Litorimonas sp.]
MIRPKQENLQKTPPKKKTLKKSETLEVRISYETKQKLARQAEMESRSVSDLVRSLIHNYLSPSQSSASSLPLRTMIMRMKKFITQKPKTALASLITILTASIAFIPAASAEDYQLNLQGEFIEPQGDGTRTRTFNTDIILDYGSTVIMQADGSNAAEISKNSDSSISDLMAHDGLWIKIRTQKGSVQTPDESLTIHVSIINMSNGVETVIAQPSLTTSFGQTVEFLMSKDEAKSYSLKFLANSPS